MRPNITSNNMYEKYLKCIFLLTICLLSGSANVISEHNHSSNYRPPQLPPTLQASVERSAEVAAEQLHANEQNYHHQHYYLEEPLPSEIATKSFAQAAMAVDGVVHKQIDHLYKPRAGEILVQDSNLYNSKTPASSLHHQTVSMRRNYWPLVDNTVTALATKAAVGANTVKNLLKVGFYSTFDNVNEAVQHKKQRIKSYLIHAAQEHQIAKHQQQEEEKHQQQLELASGKQIPLSPHPHPSFLGKHLHSLFPLKQKLKAHLAQHLTKHVRGPIGHTNVVPSVIVYSKTKPLPTTTISEDYVHTYDNSYVPPRFLNGPREKNPYAEMGVTSHKHFEDTILKELEEKEERKVEATLHTLFDDKYLLQETLLGTKPIEDNDETNEWTPLSGTDNHDALFPMPTKALPVGAVIHSSFGRPFSDIRPVCEHLDELGIPPTLFVYPAGAESQVNEQQEASNESPVRTKPSDGKLAHSNQTNISPNTFEADKLSATTATTERPNYPAYFIKQQQQVKKLQNKLLTSYRGKLQQGSYKGVQHQKVSNQKLKTRTTESPIITTTTTSTALLFYPPNATDDGFRPMSANEIEIMRINKPIRNKPNGTITWSATSTTTTTSKPIAAIQAQSSNIQFSIVSAPTTVTSGTTTTVASRAHSADTHRAGSNSAIRKTPKKIKPKAAASSSTNTTDTSNAAYKKYRGSVKFSASQHQLR